MTRIILRALNFPALILMAAIGVALQTSLFNSWLLQYLQPDVVLLVVIWVALRRGFTEGGIITLIAADIAEVHTAAPQGYYLILYMLVYLGVRGAYRLLVIPSLRSYIYLTIVAAGAMRIGGAILLSLMGGSNRPWAQVLMQMLPSAAVAGLFGYWGYQWLERFDLKTFKHARAETVSEHGLENELQLEAEGF